MTNTPEVTGLVERWEKVYAEGGLNRRLIEETITALSAPSSEEVTKTIERLTRPVSLSERPHTKPDYYWENELLWDRCQVAADLLQRLDRERRELAIKLGATEEAFTDYRGHSEGKVCGLCNIRERAACFGEREKVERQLDLVTRQRDEHDKLANECMNAFVTISEGYGAAGEEIDGGLYAASFIERLADEWERISAMSEQEEST